MKLENRSGQPIRKPKTGAEPASSQTAAAAREAKNRLRADRRWVKQSEHLASSRSRIRDLETALNEHSIVAVTDNKGKIKYVNNKFCSISKYTREELIGQDHRIINSRHHDKSFFRDMWKTIHQGKIWKGELKNQAKDGSFYWVATTIVPFTDAEGMIDEFVSIRTDITVRKNAELALRESEAKMQLLFDMMSEGVSLNEAIYDDSGTMIDYRILAVNKAFYSAADYHGKQIVNRLATDLYGMSPDEIRSFGLRHKSNTKPVTIEYTSPIHKRTYRVSTSPITNGRFVTSFLDITEHTEMKQKLKDSEAFLRKMSDSLSVPVAYWLPDHTCAFVNKAFGIWFGKPLNEFVGMHARDLLGPGVYAEHLPLYEAAFSGELQTSIGSLQTADGSHRHFVTTVIPDREESSVRGIFTVTSDVTEIKAQGEQIHELARAVMTLSEKERADISGEMHDSIGQSLVLLKLDLQKKLNALPAAHQLDVSEIIRPVDEVLKVVRGISQRLSPIFLKNLGLVTALEHMAEKVAEQSGISIQTDLAALEGLFPENWNIDFYRIAQEAVTNAIKHSGATRIRLSAIATSAMVIVEIADNGRGMAEKCAEKIGLGLLLMQHRASEFGGAVRFERLNPGLAVQVEIPVAKNR